MANKQRMVSYSFLPARVGECHKDLFSINGVEVTLYQRPVWVPKGEEFRHEVTRDGQYLVYIRNLADRELWRRVLAKLNRVNPENIILRG